jgi:DNA mismatch repair protein MSH4
VHSYKGTLALHSTFATPSLTITCTAQGGIGAVNARVYAVKVKRNRLLDVARETYKENVGDIYQLNRTLSAEHDLPLSLVYHEGTGFVFSLKASEIDGPGDGNGGRGRGKGELPEGFINVTMKKGRYTFSSMDLKKMNARMKDALDETLLLSDKCV